MSLIGLFTHLQARVHKAGVSHRPHVDRVSTRPHPGSRFEALRNSVRVSIRQSIFGRSRVNLHEANLTQWASYIQDVASGMRKPPKAAIDCPIEDIMGILHKLEKMTNITFCQFCFILGGYCRCHPEVPQAPTPLWNPPGYSYATMATVTTTSASTSMVGVPTVADPPPGYPTLPLPMDMTLPPKATNLLASVGVGRGKALQTMLATVGSPGPHQV